MSETQPTEYRISYTGRVRQSILELAAIAKARGDGVEYLAALKESDRRLRIYPQFGDPLMDLLSEPGQVRLGAVPPLAMRYGVFDERRRVLVAALPVLLGRWTGGHGPA